MYISVHKLGRSIQVAELGNNSHHVNWGIANSIATEAKKIIIIKPE